MPRKKKTIGVEQGLNELSQRVSRLSRMKTGKQPAARRLYGNLLGLVARLNMELATEWQVWNEARIPEWSESRLKRTGSERFSSLSTGLAPVPTERPLAVEPGMVERLEHAALRLSAALRQIAQALGAESFSIGLAFPVGLTVSVTFKL